jgi:hypothetical protein
VEFGPFFLWMVKPLVDSQNWKNINSIEPQKFNAMTNSDMKIKQNKGQ